MLLTISHVTRYRFDEPPAYALQQLRLWPKDRPGQKVLHWKVEIDGGTREVDFEDAHMNRVELISLDEGVEEIAIRCAGQVEVEDRAGVFGEHSGFMPIWFFERVTPLTRPGPLLRKLAREVSGEGDLARLHALMAAVAEAVTYEAGRTDARTPAEEVLSEGHGVCQDQAHVFIAAARLMGYPARYVSGYLLMRDREAQDATHAWAEAYVPGLGWVGFDVANAQCPDDAYVRIATGLDYSDAAPISGLRHGTGAEALEVSVEVAPQAPAQSQSQQQSNAGDAAGQPG